jgi:predicted metal-binding membrane protein
MMVAMMVPSAAPLVLMFARANRQKGGRRVVGSAGILLLRYLLVWIGFSAVATLAQWRLHAAAVLSPMMASTSSILGGVLLVTAGVFQFTPLKRACLVRCRSPLNFLMQSGERGSGGLSSWG